MTSHLRATRRHLLYGITQCYLLPDTSFHPTQVNSHRLTPAKKLAPNRMQPSNAADQSNRTILVTCIGTSFLYKFLERVSSLLETFACCHMTLVVVMSYHIISYHIISYSSSSSLLKLKYSIIFFANAKQR